MTRDSRGRIIEALDDTGYAVRESFARELWVEALHLAAWGGSLDVHVIDEDRIGVEWVPAEGA